MIRELVSPMEFYLIVSLLLSWRLFVIDLLLLLSLLLQNKPYLYMYIDYILLS